MGGSIVSETEIGFRVAFLA